MAFISVLNPEVDSVCPFALIGKPYFMFLPTVVDCDLYFLLSVMFLGVVMRIFLWRHLF